MSETDGDAADNVGSDELSSWDGEGLPPEAESLADEVADEVLEGVLLDDETRAELRGRIEMVIGQVQSPVPPPFMMRDYAKILPDAPERLFRMAESQMEHRQGLERRVVVGGDVRAYVGQVFALIVALVFGFFAYDLIRSGQELAGTFLGTVDLVALVSVFLVGRSKQQRQSEENRERTETRPGS